MQTNRCPECGLEFDKGEIPLREPNDC